MNYAEKNEALFTERLQIVAELEELETTEQTRETQHQTGVLKRQLDNVNRKLVELNTGLVLRYISAFTRQSKHLEDDLKAAGHLGLMAAINSYRLDRKASFSHWAHNLIKREVLTEVRKQDHQTIGQSDFEKRQRILATAQQLELENPDTAITPRMVAEKAEVTVAQATRVMFPTPILSIDKPTDTGDSDSQAELVEAIPNEEESIESQVLGRVDSAALHKIIADVLDGREYYVMVRRQGLDGFPKQTLASLGAQMGLSRESVRNIQARATRKLQTEEVVSRIEAEVGLASELL